MQNQQSLLSTEYLGSLILCKGDFSARRLLFGCGSQAGPDSQLNVVVESNVYPVRQEVQVDCVGFNTGNGEKLS